MAKQFKLNTALSLEYPCNIISASSYIKRGETFDYSLSGIDFENLAQLVVSLGQNGRALRFNLKDAEGNLDTTHFYQKDSDWYFYLKASETALFNASNCFNEMLILEVAKTFTDEYGKERVDILEPESFWVLNSLYSQGFTETPSSQAAIVSEVLYCSETLYCQG